MLFCIVVAMLSSAQAASIQRPLVFLPRAFLAILAPCFQLLKKLNARM